MKGFQVVKVSSKGSKFKAGLTLVIEESKVPRHSHSRELRSSQEQQVRFDRLESHDGRRLQVTVADFNTQAAFAGRSSSGSVSGFVAL